MSMKRQKEVFGVMKKDKMEDSIMLAYRVMKQDIRKRTVYDSGIVPSRSFVRQFLDCMKAEISDSNSSGKDTTGSDVTIPGSETHGYNFECLGAHRADAGQHNDDYGILVGASDTPPDNSDYVLGNPIHDGSESGELNYGEMTFYDPIEESGYIEASMRRIFYNGGTEDVVVKEIGLVVRHNFAGKNFLWIRDVLGTPVTVEPAQTLTVQYIMKTKA